MSYTIGTAADTLFSTDDSVSILVNTIVKSLRPVCTTVILTCIWSAMLIPLFIILLFFSDGEMRRKPIFLANLLATSLGIAFAGVALELMVSNWLYHFISSLMADVSTQVSVLWLQQAHLYASHLRPSWPAVPSWSNLSSSFDYGPSIRSGPLHVQYFSLYSSLSHFSRWVESPTPSST
jgi:hypothetical protein